MELVSFDEMLVRCIGLVGTPERDKFEAAVEKEVEKARQEGKALPPDAKLTPEELQLWYEGKLSYDEVLKKQNHCNDITEHIVQGLKEVRDMLDGKLPMKDARELLGEL